jgi:type II secretory pathway pseudopilin PulG
MFKMQVSRKSQRGISLTGLIFVVAIVGVVAVFGMRVVPSYLEYKAVKNSIAVAKANGGSVQEMRTSFDRNADVAYITTIAGRDLQFNRDNGNVEISFAYEKRLPIAGNVSLVIDYSGTTDPSGVVPEPPVTAAK